MGGARVIIARTTTFAPTPEENPIATTTQVDVPTGTWAIDPKHSSIEFRVKHLGIATVRGYFKRFEGTLEVGENITDSKASGKIETASINTNEPQRDDQLRSPDFFDAEVMGTLGSAAFVAAGGYHHHLGFNVWLGPDVKPASRDAAGLRHWTVLLDTPEDVSAVRARTDAAGLKVDDHAAAGFLVRDPWGIAVAFEPTPG